MRRIALLLLLSLAGIARAQFGVVEFHDVVYTQVSGFPQMLDVYLPTPDFRSQRPGVVFVHGGGWVSGSKADFAAFARYYASRGYVCTAINYRLAPQHVWPAQIDDTQAAVRWMRKFAPALGLDPRRIGAVGGSAGGHLVLFLGAVDTINDFEPKLRGYSSRAQVVIDYCGPTDLTNKFEWRADIWQLIQQMVGRPWPPLSNAYLAASSIAFVSPEDAPTVIFHGAADDIVPVDQSRRMAARMRSFGQFVDYYEFPGQGHGFDENTFLTCLQVMNRTFAERLGR